MKKLFFVLTLVFTFSGFLTADISDYYEFVPGTTTYTEITGTTVTAAMGDDVTSAAIDIGFTFSYGLSSYTQVLIHSNGLLALGTTVAPTRFNDLASTTICPILGALWDDLHTGRVAGTTYPQTSSVDHLLQGSAPNRTFTVQYKYAYWYYSVADSWVNFQIVLHENGNIDFIYGPNAGTSPGPSATASIGINMLPGGSTSYWSVDPTTSTASNIVQTGTINAYIPNGTKYSFNVPVPVPNDLSALSVTGTAYPAVGTSYPYTVSVRNRGTNPQTNYTVKLMSGQTELASVNGIAIQPGEIIPFLLNWTPATTGTMQLSGKVGLEGDQNALNDTSSPLTVNVQPAGTQMVIIGNGTAAQNYPFYTTYGYVRNAAIYTPAEIGLAGLVTGIQWDMATQYGYTVPYRILLKTTTETALVAQPWDTTIANAQLCAEGSVTFNQLGWVYIPFTVPFVYTGGENLVVMVEANYGGAGTTSSQTFRYTTSTTASHHYMYQDNTPPAGNGYVNASRPNVGLTLTAVSNNPAFAVSPTSWNYGQIFINLTRDKTCTVTNIGGGTTPLVINNIAIGGSPYYTLQNLPTLPLSLNSFQSATFTARYNPLTTGTHTATIVITDNLARTEHPVDLTGSAIDPTIYTSPYAQNFDGVTSPALPIDWSSLVVAPGTVTTYTTAPHSTLNCVRIYNSTAASGPYLISPPISSTLPLPIMRVKFWAKGGSTTTTLSVGAMSDPIDAATYTQISSITLTTAWLEYEVSYQTYTGTGQFIVFKHGNAASSQSVYIDDVLIEVIPQNDLAALSVTGNTTPTVNMPSNYTVNISNEGTETQTNYLVKLFQEGDIELASVPGPAITGDATVQVMVHWTPSSQGTTYIYGKVVLDGDQNNLNDQTPNLAVSVQPEGVTAITIGDGIQSARLPLDFFYRNSLFETIYQASEFNVYGLITTLVLYNSFTTNLPDKPIKIWLGTTAQSDLSTGWIPSTNLTQVFDGIVSFPSGQNTITIPLQTPFPYMQNNLVMMANRPFDTAYFSSTDFFLCQTVGTNRSRNIYSDTVTYDPASPPTTGGTNSGQFPKTTFMMVVADMGSLNGTVSSGGNPIDGALVSIQTTTLTQTTNATGTYNFPFVLPGTYQVSCSKLGYLTQTQEAVITANQASTLNFNMALAPSVNVTGTVVGSDAPAIGLAEATINLTGVLNYNGTTNALGQFTIPSVLAGNTYNYTIARQGYQNATGSITIGISDYNMGTVVLSEIASPPVAVHADLNVSETAVTVMWRAPGATSPYYQEDFETTNGGWVPSSNWTNPLGDWEWTNTYNVSNFVHGSYPTSEIPPPLAHSGTGLWGTILYAPYTNSGGFSYLTHTFDFTGYTGTQMRFWSWENLFGNFDYAQVKVNGNLVWGPTTVAINSWQEVVIDLSAYDGQANVVIQLEEYASTVVNYAGWYVDDFYIGPASGYIPARYAGEQALDINSRDLDRTLTGYRVWRLLQGQEANEAGWTQLTTNAVTDTFYVDNDWQSIPDGNYRWAVKSVYTNNVLSVPSFSNMVMKRPNDLSALTITGPLTPSVGNSSGYTISIRNTGTAAQSPGGYTVKVMSGTSELASVVGPAINPGETLDVVVPWTPATAGVTVIYGKVVLSTDTLPTNDQTPNLNIFVHPMGTLIVTIGNGTSTQAYPFYTTYGYARDASIYTAAEIGVPGLITGVQWDMTTQAGNTIPYRILLKTTVQTQLVAQPWATTITDAQLCADGTITLNQPGWVYIPFTTPFLYTGDNLIIMVEANYGGTGTTANQNFRYTTATTASHHYMGADTTPPTGNGTVNASRPNIGLSLTSTGTVPAFNVSPTSWNYGQTFVNLVMNKTVTITNIGGGTNPLIINSIVISGSPYFTLQNLPTLPLTLNSFQSANFVARYNPTEVGTHTATIVITDNLGRAYTFRTGRDERNESTRTQHPIDLSGECIDPTIYTSPYAQNFDAVTSPALPIDWSSLVVAPGTVTSYTTSPHSTPNSVRIYNSTAPSGPYLISPPISSTLPINSMRIKFWAKGSSTTTTLSVGGMSDPYDAGTYMQVQSLTLTTVWVEYIVGFQTYAGTGHFMVFKHGNAASSQSVYIDDVTIEVIPQNDLAATTVTGNTTPSVNMTTNYTVNLFNWGTNPQSDYLVKLFREGDVEIGSVAGPAINPGMTGQVVVPWTPMVQGLTFIYGKVILTGDQNNLNDQTPNLNVSVFPAGTMVVTIGDGGQNARMPLDFYYRNSLLETIYLSSELNFIGLITGVTFYNNFLTNLPDKPVKFWLGTTTQTDLSGGWIPSTALTSVFDGTITFPSGQNSVTVTFPTPYLYLGGNLVMMANRPMDTQFFSSSDYFICQTVGTNRSRNIFSDSVTYDPAAPPSTGGTNTGQFPKTSLMVIPGGVGHLNGTVYGAGNQPLENATVQIAGGATATTNAQGQYSIINILADTYQVTASRFGYINQTLTVIIPEDSTVVQNFTLEQMPTVNVMGTIVGSDVPTLGLAGAVINLTGYDDYTATTNVQGQFTITGVYTNQTYNYQASAAGYQQSSGTINVGGVDYSMGTLILNEIAYTPREVNAVQNNPQLVTINWLAPDPNAVDITEGFEEPLFPPVDWTRIVTNNGPANTVGVYPTWCRFGAVQSGTDPVTPHGGSWQAGFWWDYNHQDEWLITPQFNCPQGAVLTFWTYAYYGSVNDDHFYVKLTTNNGNTWDILWDATALTGGYNIYQTPVVLDLSAYAGQQAKIAWHADDPNASSDGMWYNWFIDDVIIESTAGSMRFALEDMSMRSASVEQALPSVKFGYAPSSRTGEKQPPLRISKTAAGISSRESSQSSRSIEGYKVWRLVLGQELNEQTWTLLTPEMITNLSFDDNGWGAVDAGTYKWAVKAVYTNNVFSQGAFSNSITKAPMPMGTLVGVVRNLDNIPINGATITAGAYSTQSLPNGSYNMPIAAGTYAVTCTATDYEPMTIPNIVITENQTTICSFTLTPTAINEDVLITRTELQGNYPNPFNPETTIAFDIKGVQPVRIEIYNLKGQFIRTLVNEIKSNGHHIVVWNGRDEYGKAVASGIYQYRMQSGDYTANRRMLLLK